MQEDSPDRWSSHRGFILATIGSAVGLGSIWKFPYEVGRNGGGGFLLFYMLGLALVVLPLMLAELLIGRRSRADLPSGMASLAQSTGRNPRWGWVGVFAIATGFIILSYYAVIGCLTIAYAEHAVLRGFAGINPPAAAELFAAITGDPIAFAAYHAAFVAATASVVARGITGGIEAACRVLMPLLMLLMVALAVYASVVGDVGRAAEFMLVPRLESLTPRVALEALGLGFFSIGAGLGVMATYAAHAARDTPLGLVTVVTILGDTAISLLAGFAVMPLVFAQGLDPSAGASLMFLSLPVAFGGLPAGDLVGLTFFVALFAAALASAISLFELAVAPLVQYGRLTRAQACLILGVVCWAVGLPSLLSFNLWSDVRPLAVITGFEGAGIFDALDRVASNLMLPVSGFLLAVFGGRVLSRFVFAEELGWPAAAVGGIRLLLRWIAPGLIAMFLVLGILSS